MGTYQIVHAFIYLKIQNKIAEGSRAKRASMESPIAFYS